MKAMISDSFFGTHGFLLITTRVRSSMRRTCGSCCIQSVCAQAWSRSSKEPLVKALTFLRQSVYEFSR